MDTIRFEIVKETDKQYRKYYDVVLILNDIILQGGVFNLASVLGAQRCNGIELYPFTCSCGEPGCAGFFTEVKQFRNDSIVKWIFPNTEEYKVDKLEYCFDVKHFDFQLDVLKFLVINSANKKRHPIYSMSNSNYNLLGDINYRKKRFNRVSKSYENLSLNFSEYINTTYYYEYEEQTSWEYNFQDLVYMLIGESPEYVNKEEFNSFLKLCIVGARTIVEFLSDNKLLFSNIFEDKNLNDLCYKLNNVDNFDINKLKLVRK